MEKLNMNFKEFFKSEFHKGMLPTNSINEYYKDSGRGKCITVLKRNLFSKDTSFFSIGSCFAIEIRKQLKNIGFEVYPKYNDINFNHENEVIEKLPRQDTLAHYTTNSIEQEISKALNNEYYSSQDFFKIQNPKNSFARSISTYEVFQDPYRRDVYAKTREEIILLSKKITDKISEGLKNSDVIIITLGLIEAWINIHNRLWVCRCPKRDDDPEWKNIEFHLSNFKESYVNLEKIVQQILEKYPRKKIIFTVSPVPLGRTFTDNDIIVANVQSKCTLRTAVGELIKQYKENVFYWPAFEYSLSKNIFQKDGRHVQTYEVNNIVKSFIESFIV
jgi:hypothetical protein